MAHAPLAPKQSTRKQESQKASFSKQRVAATDQRTTNTPMFLLSASQPAQEPEIIEAKEESFKAHPDKKPSPRVPVDEKFSNTYEFPTLQPKLAVGEPGDIYEQEADHVADRVMRMSEPGVQRQVEEEEEEELLQTKQTSQSSFPKPQQSSEVPSIVHEALHSPGQALDPSLKTSMERRFRQDFGHVRVHTDPRAAESAQAINARAYTVSHNIVFGPNEYAPNTHEGQRLLAHELTHVVQQSSTIPHLQKQQEGESLDPDFFYLSGVERAQANMDRRIYVISAYSTIGREAADTVRAKLLAFAGQYGIAYDRYARVIHAAEQEAQNQEKWINIIVGIGVGAIIGLGAAWMLPSTAAGAFVITLNEAGVALASSAGQAVAGTAIMTPITEALRPAGTDLEPGGLEPAVLRMRIWRRIAEMYRSTSILTDALWKLHMFSNAAEYLRGEIRRHVDGVETDMNEEEVLDFVEDLVIADNRLQRYDSLFSQKLENVRQLQQAANALSVNDYPVHQMEQDIWILWMSELGDSDILDLDEIEDYLHGRIGILGPGSRLGIDFGSWTSEEDERAAINAAKREAPSIRNRLRNLEGESL